MAESFDIQEVIAKFEPNRDPLNLLSSYAHLLTDADVQIFYAGIKAKGYSRTALSSVYDVYDALTWLEESTGLAALIR